MGSHKTSRSFRSRPSSILSLSIPLLLLGFPSASSAFDCKDISTSGVKFNLKELGGPRVVHWEEEADLEHAIQYKYNFTIDICNTLQWHKGGNSQTECHHGTQICAMRETHDLAGHRNVTLQPIEIAGTYTTKNGRKMDEKFELLRDSKSNSDAQREGLRAELHGGRFPFDSKTGLEQQAIIEFVCDKDRTGTEGAEKDEGERVPDEKDGEDGGDKDGKDDKEGKEKSERLRRREDEKKDETNSLRFLSYASEEAPKDKKKIKSLRLEWRTKYACENAENDSVSSHWGFFTWFLIIVFLAIATYLIFGSWLNYNRYGARGWDLLPHGDTIRDLPYLLKDYARRMKDSMQGSGSRGGYSAV